MCPLQPVKGPAHLALCGAQCLVTFSWVCFPGIGHLGGVVCEAGDLVVQTCNPSEVRLSQEHWKLGETLRQKIERAGGVVPL